MSQKFAVTDADGFVTGFYVEGIHLPDKIPAGAIPITDEAHQALIAGQAVGKRQKVDPDGTPVLVDRPPLTAEQIAEQKKAEAQAYLNSTDWYVMRKLELGTDIPADVSEKRAEARALLSS